MDFQSREEEICSTALCCGWSESLRSTTFPVAAKPCVAGSICAFKSYCVMEKALRSRACRGSADSKQRRKRSFKFRVSSFKQYLFCMTILFSSPLCFLFHHFRLRLVILSADFWREGSCVFLAGEESRQHKTLDSKLETCFHFCFARRWRTISYITTPAATETFKEGTLPSMGMETRKSHLRRTRSCSPLPSAPRIRAQSML